MLRLLCSVHMERMTQDLNTILIWHSAIFKGYLRQSMESLKASSAAGAAQLTPQVKALTLQLPNERELKNETRWIYCWNLWTELIRRRQLELAVSNGEVDLRLVLNQPGKNDPY